MQAILNRASRNLYGAETKGINKEVWRKKYR